MKLFRRFVGLVFILMCVYFFRLWLQQQKDIEITQTTHSVVSQLQSIKRLETAQMTVLQHIEWEDKLADLIPWVGIDDMIQSFLFKDKISLQVEWVVVAGFNLAKVDSGSVMIHEDKSVTLKLPEAEILHTKLTDGTKPFERELWVFTKGDVEMESKIRNQAKNMIREAAIQQNILEEAEKNVQIELKELLQTMGVNIKDIIIERPLD